MKDDKRPLMVTILCTAYNHERYIRQCLEGFVMQKTNFRFEAIVHDDASTDATASIIREYSAKYPHIIKPILQTENQYSQGKKIGAIMAQHFPFGKYIAECEGDDYWTDPEKLQRQVDFLESHPDYSTVCNRTQLYSEYRQQFVGENRCYEKSQAIEVKDVIVQGGLFISTCSLLYRKSILPATLPDYWQRCHVGDYPLQIHAAMSGKIYYFDEAMSVYRVENKSSWAGRRETISIDELIATVKSEVQMLEGFAVDYPQYERFFSERIRFFIKTQCPYKTATREDLQKYFDAFQEEIIRYGMSSKIKVKIRSFCHNLLRTLRPHKFMHFLQKLHLIY